VTFLHKTRLRVLAFTLGLGLAALGLISLTAIPAWPVLGVAFAVAVVACNKLALRLSDEVCLGCGSDLASQPKGERGVICPSCGTINHWLGDDADDELLAQAEPAPSPEAPSSPTPDQTASA
jgi:hypothetical protein